MRIFSPLLLTLLMATGCNADESDIKKNLESRFPGIQVQSVGKSPVDGLYEVVVAGNEIIYADGQGKYIVTGEMIQTENRRSVTRERLDKLNEVKFDSLPLDQAIKDVRGDGKRVMAVFSDPDCPYCRKLEHELAKVDNVTIYTFVYPLPMHPDAPRKSRLVWCSADRVQAWKELMMNGKVPSGKDNCANPIEANLALGQKLNVSGTPAIILANGKRLPGYAPADRLNALLDEASK